jgi:hypothetical protein
MNTDVNKMKMKKMGLKARMKKILCSLIAAAMIVPVIAVGSAATVSANAPAVPTIDFANELLVISGAAATGDAVLLYALNVRSTGGIGGVADMGLASARWMPTYTGVVDIGRFIPATDRPERPYIIAVRWSNMPATLENTRLVELPGRQAVNRREIVYDGERQGIRAPGPGFEMRLENDWGWTSINTPAPTEDHPAARILNFPIDWLPTGGTALVRMAASGQNFASQTARIRLPRQPAPPRVSRVIIREPNARNQRAFFVGLTDRMEVFSGNQWIPLERNMTVFDFAQQVARPGRTDQPIGAPAYRGGEPTMVSAYTFYVRTAPRGDAPASAPVSFSIPAERFNEAIHEIRTTTTRPPTTTRAATN